MGIRYLSLEWHQREVKRLGQQLVNAERQNHALHLRNVMLVEYMAAKGLPLDEVEMRAWFESNAAGDLMVRRDAERLEIFRTDMVMVAYEVEQTRGHVPDGSLLDAVVKAIGKSLRRCKNSEMPAAEAREAAAQMVASIPEQVPAKV